MRTTKAFIASFGTSALLVASSVTMLAIVSAVLAFNSIPGAQVAAPSHTLVVSSGDEVDPVELTQQDVEAATEPDAADTTAAEDVEAPASVAATGSGGSAPVDAGGGSGSPGPLAGDGGAAPAFEPEPVPGDGGGGAGPLDDVPGVRELRGLELGDAGRRATRTLADDVVGRASPEVGDTLERATEPVWKLLD